MHHRLGAYVRSGDNAVHISRRRCESSTCAVHRLVAVATQSLCLPRVRWCLSPTGGSGKMVFETPFLTRA